MLDLLIDWIWWVGVRRLTGFDNWMKGGENKKSRNSEDGADLNILNLGCLHSIQPLDRVYGF